MLNRMAYTNFARRDNIDRRIELMKSAGGRIYFDSNRANGISLPSNSSPSGMLVNLLGKSGKNLFDLNINKFISGPKVTIGISVNKEFVVTAKQSDQSWCYARRVFNLKPNTKYTFKAQSSRTAAYGGGVAIVDVDTGSALFSAVDTLNPTATFTTKDGGSIYINFYAVTTAVGGGAATYWNMQLELGDGSAYEVNTRGDAVLYNLAGTTSSGWVTEQVPSGRNMHNGKMELGTYSMTDGSKSSNPLTCCRCADRIRCIPGAQYIASNDKGYGIVWNFYDENLVYISSSTSNPVTAPVNSVWMTFRTISANNESDITVKFQIEKGGITTPWESYRYRWITYLRCDGVDDYGSMFNYPDADISAAPLAIFATVRIDPSSGGKYIICKSDGVNIGASVQYGLYYDATNKRIQIVLNGVTRSSTLSSSIVPGAWMNIGFIWDGSVLKKYVNGVPNGAQAAYVDTLLTGLPVFELFKNTTSRLKGDLGAISLYAGANATEVNILKPEREIMREYLIAA